ncbi:MAG: hypothetical protein NUV63_10655 [Gallionella sp.]|nr:hypothetical protein [Gallionella sp.]
MSFVITMYVREGIVMAADSRLTLNTTQTNAQGQIVKVPVPQSDSNYKVFLTTNKIGILTCGVADIGGVPIAGYIESFISNILTGNTINIDAVPQLLLQYFRQFQPIPDTMFYVAGYMDINGQKEPRVWHINLIQNSVNRLNLPGQQGANWGGEIDVLTRLINHVGALDQQGSLINPLPLYNIPFQYFTLQDAIDFCIFAIRSTIDLIRFQPRAKTVGGPIDVLVIKPDEAFWVQRKELHGETHVIKE